MRHGQVTESAAAERPAVLPASAILEKFGGRRGQQLLAVAAAVQMATPALKWARGRVAQREDFTITVAGDDVIYPDLHEWVLARIPQADRKALIASTPQSLEVYGVDEQPPAPAQVRLRYDGSKQQDVVLDGHRVTVAVEREDTGVQIGRGSENWRQYLEKIVFTASSSGGRDAIVRMMNGLLADQRTRKGPPPLLIPSRWGGSWNRRGDLPPRTLDSIVLKDGQLELLVGDLARFLAGEAEYERVCLPWHRGYLFHGAPGTGKTSVARALANRFDMPMYYMPLGDLEKDADLMSLVAAIQPRSMLLLEDADVFHAATDRDDDSGASLAAMLNALDGVWTPHGLVTVMTTNSPDALDAALVRAGRVDVDEEFTLLDGPQAAALARWFDGDAEGDADRFVGSSPASMIEALRAERVNREEAAYA